MAACVHAARRSEMETLAGRRMVGSVVLNYRSITNFVIDRIDVSDRVNGVACPLPSRIDFFFLSPPDTSTTAQFTKS